MKTKGNINWTLLLEGNKKVKSIVSQWSTGEMSTRTVAELLKWSEEGREMRRLVKDRGVVQSRNLARKAISYREALV